MKGEDNDIGDVGSVKIELGTAYRRSDRHRFGLGLRLASQNYEFDSGDDQAHQMVGLFFRYDYQYGL